LAGFAGCNGWKPDTPGLNAETDLSLRIGEGVLSFLLLALAGVTSEVGAESVIQKYCEPLISGESATQLEAKLLTNGFTPEVLAGQRVLRRGELIVGLSDSPRVCFVQAPLSMSVAQGFEAADRWAGRLPGAVRSPATKGPDGAPVRGWSAPGKKMGLIASQQTSASGQKVMAFVLMPLPKRGSR